MAGASGRALVRAGNGPVARGGLQAMGWASVYWGGEPTARHRTIIVIVVSDAGARSGAPLVAGEKTARRVGSHRKGGSSGCAFARAGNEPVARGGLQAMGWASVYWGGEPTARHRTIHRDCGVGCRRSLRRAPRRWGKDSEARWLARYGLLCFRTDWAFRPSTKTQSNPFVVSLSNHERVGKRMAERGAPCLTSTTACG